MRDVICIDLKFSETIWRTGYPREIARWPTLNSFPPWSTTNTLTPPYATQILQCAQNTRERGGEPFHIFRGSGESRLSPDCFRTLEDVPAKIAHMVLASAPPFGSRLGGFFMIESSWDGHGVSK